ncbi:MAG: filamentous hemagglutinin N-terminal domain-containing protein [Cyanobacteriota bacterium]
MTNLKPNYNLLYKYLFYCLTLALLSSPVYSQVSTITPGPNTNVTTVAGIANITTNAPNIFNNVAVNNFSDFEVYNTDLNEVRFVYPNSIFFMMNRISNPAILDTLINGIISSPLPHVGGTMMFASPSGITIGPNATINVGSLILTTANQINYNGGLWDMYNDTDLTTTNGINPASPLIFVKSSFSGPITNAGLIRADGTDTFAGAPPTILIDSLGFTNQASGSIHIQNRFGVDIPGGSINVAIGREAKMDLSTSQVYDVFSTDFPPLAFFPAIVNPGEIQNAGLIQAREGEITLSVASSESLTGGYPGRISNSGGIITEPAFGTPEAFGGIIALRAEDDPNFINQLGNTSIVNTGSILARPTITNPAAALVSQIFMTADIITNDPPGFISVLGQNATSKSGEFIITTSPNNLHQNIEVGFDFSGGPAIHLNNDFFADIDNNQAFTPPNIRVAGYDIIASNFNLIEGVEVGLDAVNNITTSSQVISGSSINFMAGNQININANVIGVFDTIPGYEKYLRFEAPTINLDIAGNSDIVINSVGANYPIIMRADAVNNLNVAGNEIRNFDNTGNAGIFAFQPDTVDHNMILNGNLLNITTSIGAPVSTVDLSNVNLGNNQASLLIGNPVEFDPYLGRITINALPVSTAYDNGVFLAFTNINAPGNAITFNNINFAARNIDAIAQAPDVGNGNIGLLANLNNDFSLLSIITNGNAIIADSFSGMSIDISSRTGYFNDVNIYSLNLSTPIGYAGNLNLWGNIAIANILNAGTGNINLNTTSPNLNISDIIANNGQANIINNGNITLLNLASIQADDISIIHPSGTLGDIILSGNIQAVGSDILIFQENPGSDLRVENSATIQSVPIGGPAEIALESEGNLFISGTVEIDGTLSSPDDEDRIFISANTLEFDNLSPTPPLLRVITSDPDVSPIITMNVNNIINGTSFYPSAIIQSFNQNTLEGGVFAISRFTDGNIAVNSTGIDINGVLNDISFENIYIGNYGASLAVGDPIYNIFDPPIIGRVNVLGKPTNSYGSFDYGSFIFSSYINSAVIDGVNIANSDFSDSMVGLNAPFATGLAGVSANVANNFQDVLVKTEGSANIIDADGGMNIISYVYMGTVQNSRASNLNVQTTNGELSVRGDFDQVNMSVNGAGNIIFTDLLNGIVVNNATANNGYVRIDSTNNLSVPAGATVEGVEIAFNNVPDPLTSAIQGNIVIDGYVHSQDGNVGITTAQGRVIFGPNSFVQMDGISYYDSGNLLIRKSFVPGNLVLDFIDGFNITSNPIPATDNGYISIGDNFFNVFVYANGSQAGALSASSPYEYSTYFSGPTGNINVKTIAIETTNGAPLPPPEEDPALNPFIVDWGFVPDNSTPIVIGPGDIFLVNNITGERISLINDPDSDNVIQQDFFDGTPQDEFTEFGGNYLIDGGFNPANSGYFLEPRDNITFDFRETINDSNFVADNEDGSFDNFSSPDNDIYTPDKQSFEEGADRKPPGDFNNNDNLKPNFKERDFTRKNHANPDIVEAMKSDDPIDYTNNNVMSSMFSVCQGSNSCNNIVNTENIKLARQLLFVGNDNEYMADKFGTLFASKSGYHPNGLRGFLMTLNKIEENVDNIAENVGKQYTPVFSYRHPKTSDRIDKVKDQIEDEDLLKIKNKRINKKEFKSIIDSI